MLKIAKNNRHTDEKNVVLEQQNNCSPLNYVNIFLPHKFTYKFGFAEKKSIKVSFYTYIYNIRNKKIFKIYIYGVITKADVCKHK